jgi:hypothetical protein
MKFIVTIIACLGLFVGESQAVFTCKSACKPTDVTGKMQEAIRYLIRMDTVATDDGEPIARRNFKITPKRAESTTIGSPYGLVVEWTGHDEREFENFIDRQLKAAATWTFSWGDTKRAHAMQLRQMKTCLKDKACQTFRDAVSLQKHNLSAKIFKTTLKYGSGVDNDDVCELGVLNALLKDTSAVSASE